MGYARQISIYLIGSLLVLFIVLWISSLFYKIDIDIRLSSSDYVLGEPVRLYVSMHNKYPVRLFAGPWTTQAMNTCDEMSRSRGIGFAVYSSRHKELSFRPRLPEPDFFKPDRVEPWDHLEVHCDLTEVFNLSKPGRYLAKAEISGDAFRFGDSSWRRIYHRSVNAELASVSKQIVAGFEVRRLTAKELVEVRQRAQTGEIAAIRILGAHQDTGAVEALAEVWSLPRVEARREAAQALADIPGRSATDALGNGLVLESHPELKAEMARLMIHERHGIGAETWIRRLVKDTVVFHEVDRDGSHYRFYRLRDLAKSYFERLGTPIDVEVMVQQ